MRAAVFHEVGQPHVEVRDDVETVMPGPGEVRVAIRATGVCHSDLSAMDGTLPQPPPCVLGHEGAGEVVAVGEGVTELAEGDHIIVAWTPPCGECSHCRRGEGHLCMTHMTGGIANPRFRVGDTPYFGMAGTGTFVEEVTMPRVAAVKVADDVPFDIAALIGCGVMTGVGSVFNVAQVRPGDRVAVIGCGGVGISAIQGARIAGAAEIVAVDLVPRKLQWAEQFGATHSVHPDDAEAVKHEVTAGEGFDHVFEVVGAAATIRLAYELTRRGGQTIVVGAGSAEAQVTFNAFELFFMDRTIRPSFYGGADVRRDFDRLIALWRAGRLVLEPMITRRLPIEEIDDAFQAVRSGEVIRQVVMF